MAYLVGLDEAGYGPNLGPLVVSASVWEVAAGADELDALLAPVVQRSATTDLGRVAIADSKQLYQPGKSLWQLERGVLAALAVRQQSPALPRDWRSLWPATLHGDASHVAQLPWHEHYEAPLPTAGAACDLAALATTLRTRLTTVNVQLVELRARAVFPAEFNALINQHGNKGTALSTVTLQLLADVTAPLAVGPIHVTCDKHGGRNRYGELLQRQFPERLVEVGRESQAESRYAWGPPDRRMEVRFRTGGEESLPTALASMLCKYLREQAMAAWNTFWQSHLPKLRPTAGYPVDAARFHQEIAPTQHRLGIADDTIWRKR